MKVAENRIGKPLFNNDSEATYLWAVRNSPQFAMVRNLLGGETVTLAFVDVPLDLDAWLKAFEDGKEYAGEVRTIVAGSLLNPLDQLNRKVGRKEALTRLEMYLIHGTQKRHKDGRKADHFVVELTKDEITAGWQTRVAELMVKNTFLGKNVQTMEKNLAAIEAALAKAGVVYDKV